MSADLLSVLGQDKSNDGEVHFSDPLVLVDVLMGPHCNHLLVVVLILYAFTCFEKSTLEKN